jgi:hypothetical protein
MDSDKPIEDTNKHLWDTFARLGERIGDGDMDANEARWVNHKRILI